MDCLRVNTAAVIMLKCFCLPTDGVREAPLVRLVANPWSKSVQTSPKIV